MIDPETLLGRLGIEAQPRGGKLHATCPSPEHDDRKPSWAAWQDELGRFRHRCLSCGFGGGPARLVVAVLGCELRAAYDFLDGTEQAGPPPPLYVRVEVRDAFGRLEHDTIPDDVWFEDYDKWPGPARVYLENRRLGRAEVERWGLGYVVDGRYRGRIWIPVRDVMGSLQSWTTRAFDGGEPKYDSSPRPAQRTLLGEVFWRVNRRGVVVVVEGPFDAMAVAGATGESVAALRGSIAGAALDPGHAASLSAFDEVVVAVDPDKAGDKAWGHLEGLRRWTRLRRAQLPKGIDCAKLLELEGPAALAAALGLEPRAEARASAGG